MKKHAYPITLMSLALVGGLLLGLGPLLVGEQRLEAAQTSTVAVVDAFDYEDLTVTSAAAVPFDAAKHTPANAPSAKLAIFTVETANVRFKLHGVAPTASSGHQGTPATEYQVWGINNIRRFRVIAESTTAAVRVTYYR
jgi:hypothetical protein